MGFALFTTIGFGLLIWYHIKTKRTPGEGTPEPGFDLYEEKEEMNGTVDGN